MSRTLAPAAGAKTRTSHVVEFTLDPVSTQLVASDPMKAAVSLARSPGGSMIGEDAWFAMLTVGHMADTIRQTRGPRPCLVGTYELSATDSARSATWSVDRSCARVVPEFARVIRTSERGPDGRPIGSVRERPATG
ncbi:hypothetical protein L5G28_12940 [Gordonia sp. HY285]|uniref:hypothetical protein n=1 Tax=Gordonia liuliyuniae TaxID=2911517 RepID=UPI001F45C208|nr:hypothetical protein [Gordonia liuliyuniae]MCF8611053.1 hypothetical protein [Gordonia liuliyuniae]